MSSQPETLPPCWSSLPNALAHARYACNRTTLNVFVSEVCVARSIQAAAREWRTRVVFCSLRNVVIFLQSMAQGRFAKAELHYLQAVAAVAKTFGEEVLGSRETPSQQDPKVTCKNFQDLHLVKSSPKDVSLEPHYSYANPPTGTHYAKRSFRSSRTTKPESQIKLKEANLESFQPDR